MCAGAERCGTDERANERKGAPPEGSRREAERIRKGGRRGVDGRGWAAEERGVEEEKGMEGCPGHAVRNDGRQFRLLDVNMKYVQ